MSSSTVLLPSSITVSSTLRTFDAVSFWIGLLIGAIVMLVIIYACYVSRVLFFTYCPTTTPGCAGADYYNDPGDALANNPNITPAEILFLNDNNQLLYKRVPAVSDCIPESNQTVHIKYPQYCSFGNASGVTGTWKETAFNSNIYNPVGVVGPTITTDGDCQPVGGSPVTTGIPLIQWDPNPISV